MNGTLAKEELVKACGEVSGGVFLSDSSEDASRRELPPQDEDVIEFIVKCPLPELQDLLNPELLDKALTEMDTDDDGTISKDEWTDAVGSALSKLLDERQKDRDADNEFAIDFQTKAREVFEMIDVRRRCPNRRDVHWIVCCRPHRSILHRRTIPGRWIRRS